MKRIFALGISLIMISSLAWVESNSPISSTPTAYRLDVGSYKLLVVTPLDAKRSVLIGVKKPLQKRTESFLAEGVVGLAISRAAKLAGKTDSSDAIKKYVKEMVQARALSAKNKTAEVW